MVPGSGTTRSAWDAEMRGLPEPGDRFARYIIERRLGRGGMGVVYAARQDDLDREVALKLLSPELLGEEGYSARFRREATALARLESAHVVQVHDAGEHDGWLYIVTQLVPDGDLADLLEREGALSCSEAIALVDQVLDGLRDAHAAGVLHRDIKPSNVLVRRTPAGLRVYLCDFGISQLVDSDHTVTQGVAGTLGYMAPERHLGEAASRASDIYSVGCLLWALVTGHPPYGGTGFKVALRHQNDPIPQLAGTDPEATTVNRVVRRSMSKSPGERYQDAAEMRADLRAAPVPRADGSIVAPTVVRQPAPEVASWEPTELRAATPTVRRSPWLIPAVAACAVGLVVLMSLVLLDVVRGGDSSDATADTSTEGTDSAPPSASSGSTGATSPSAPAVATVGPGLVSDLASGLFCRDLMSGGYSYSAAIDYWRMNGEPNRMDADRNGIPCETVYSASDVAAYWGDRLPEGGSVAAPAPAGLFCRDLFAAGYSYAEAVDYWYSKGKPTRMDEDLNGIPCETVYPASLVADYWSR
jgi:serine/threonine protein kinase